MGHSLPCCAPADKAQRTRATVKTLPVNVRQTLLMVVSPPWWYRIASNRARAPNALDRARCACQGGGLSASEVRPANEVVAEQLRRRPAEDDATGLHHVAAVGHPEGKVRVLLDHEHRGTAPPDVGDDLEGRLHQGRCEAERGLVEQDQPRPRHQRAGDREHLLLAARERARHLPPPISEDRELGGDALEVLVHSAAVAPHIRSYLEILQDREMGKDATSLGTVGDARGEDVPRIGDRKSTRLNSSHLVISYAVFCLKKKNRPRLQSP